MRLRGKFVLPDPAEFQWATVHVASNSVLLDWPLQAGVHIAVNQ